MAEPGRGPWATSRWVTGWTRRLVGPLPAVAAQAGRDALRYAVGVRPRPRGDGSAGPATADAAFGRPRTVVADDGVQLYVEEVGPSRAPLTVIFCHGLALNLLSWREAAGALDGLARLVFYDQRGHGRSGRGVPEHATLDQLGRDLSAVLGAVAPTGRVVLVGHSLGGMTILALATQRPGLFHRRVAGVALVSTSAGRMAEVTFGLPALLRPLTRRLWPVVGNEAGRGSALLEQGGALDSATVASLIQHYAMGPAADPALAERIQLQVAAMPVEVLTELLPAFVDHDKLAALPVLASVPVTVIVGERDLITPAEHSHEIAAALPQARLVIVPGAGHMVIMERGAEVSGQLCTLLARAAPRGWRRVRPARATGRSA